MMAYEKRVYKSGLHRHFLQFFFEKIKLCAKTVVKKVIAQK